MVARLYEAFPMRPGGVMPNQDALSVFFDPEVELCLDAQATVLGLAATYRGYEGLAQTFDDVMVAFDDVRFVPEKLTPIGDRVVAIVMVTMRGDQSGLVFDQRIGNIWTFRGGRVVRWEFYFHVPDALEAAGLSG